LPDSLCVDSQGRLFHPTPITSILGLISSTLSQELSIHESSYTQSEIEYSLKQQEITRKLTLELQEEYQNIFETQPNLLGGLIADQWIRIRVQRELLQLKYDIVYSKYTIEWQGKIY